MDDATQSSPPKTPVLRYVVFGAVGIIALCVAGFLLQQRYDFTPLYSGLAIEDAAMITDELSRQNVRFRVLDGGTTVAVPAARVDTVRLALYASDGPARGLSGFELFNESEMGLTDFAQKIKFQRAIQGELSRTIIMMDGISKARVHIALPERSVFRSQNVPAKASVTLFTQSGFELTEATVAGIQSLVTSSISDLSLEHVAVMDASGRTISKPIAVSPDMPEVAVIANADPVPKADPALIPSTEQSTGHSPAAQAPVAFEISGTAEIPNRPSTVLPPHQTPPVFASGVARTVSMFGLGLLVLLAVFLLWRRRTGLSGDERTAFALELGQALHSSAMEPGRG